MNDQVLELLKQSSGEVRLTREKKDAQEAREKASMERFINKSKSNAKKLYRYLLKKAIHKYINDPISILNFNELKRHNDYEISVATLEGSKLKSVYGRRLAEKHNGTIYSYSNKKRVVFYSQDGGNPVPVIIEDLFGCTLEKDSIKTIFSNEFIRLLTIQAHEGKALEDWCDLYDQKTIELLKHAYSEVESKAKEMDAYLESIRKNASLVYYDSYKKLLEEYKNNHREHELFVFIKQKNNYSDYKRLLFNKATKDDEIVYCSYTNENDEEVFVPVQMSVLTNMFEQDRSIGFRALFNNFISFDTTLFENGLIQIDKEEHSKKLL